MSYQSISFEIQDDLAFVGFAHDHSMPLLNERTLKELERALQEVTSQKKQLRGLIFFSHHERAFLAGADIKLIAAMKTESQAVQGAEWGQKLFNGIEDLNIPTVACVHGICLGGGCELVLSCDHIYASDAPHTQIGLPEVQLGLIPAFGGTYRMPKRVELPQALELILSGKKVTSKKAKSMGLVDEVYPKERLLEMAKKMILQRPRKKSLKERLYKSVLQNFITRKIIFTKARENVLKKTKGFYQAPLKILDVMEEGYGKARTPYLNMESQAFGELCMGTQGQNLLHIFFLMDEAKKYPVSQGNPAVTTHEITQGAVLGAGSMGGGIAWLLAKNGQAPIMKDVSVEALNLGLKQSGQNFRQAVKRKKISFVQYQKWQRSITPTLHYEGFSSVGLVIEAVPENMQLKKKILKEVEQHLGQDCLITSNTSSLSIQEMAQALDRPERFAGLHFFNPVHRMPLVEIITHDQVAPETTRALYQWVLAVKKTPLIVKDGPGFLVNRILMPYMNEAMHLLGEGVKLADIEKACLNFGMPMGPFRLMDEVGLDVAVKVGEVIYKALGNRMTPSSRLKEMVNEGLLGRKGHKGFYLYGPQGKQEELNLQGEPSRRPMAMEETTIQMRIFLPMINEASYILGENIVATPEEVDRGLIFGIGFPPFRGGLLRYADYEGLDRIVSSIKDFAKDIDPKRYEVSPYLQTLVDEKRQFYS